LVQRRIHRDIDQVECVRPYRYSREQEDRDIRNPDLPCQKPSDRADRKDYSATQQRVLGDLD